MRFVCCEKGKENDYEEDNHCFADSIVIDSDASRYLFCDARGRGGYRRRIVCNHE